MADVKTIKAENLDDIVKAVKVLYKDVLDTTSKTDTATKETASVAEAIDSLAEVLTDELVKIIGKADKKEPVKEEAPKTTVTPERKEAINNANLVTMVNKINELTTKVNNLVDEVTVIREDVTKLYNKFDELDTALSLLQDDVYCDCCDDECDCEEEDCDCEECDCCCDEYSYDDIANLLVGLLSFIHDVKSCDEDGSEDFYDGYRKAIYDIFDDLD